MPAKHGEEVALHEKVLELVDPKKIWVDAFFHERSAHKLALGTVVEVRALDGGLSFSGTIESVRAGVGRIAYQGETAVSPGEYVPRRVAVRIRINGDSPFDASQFYGVGRSVTVTLKD